MRAVVYDRYGPPEVLHIEDVERPVPGYDEVLVRVRASTVTQTDCHMRRARPYLWRLFLGLTRPKRRILGLEFAGEVEEVGAAVKDFHVGDRVFGMRSGSHAEYVNVRESGFVAHMPAGMTFEDAAAVCDGANQGMAHLKEAKVGTGTRLLVYGASGSCGTAAVQLAHNSGAHVTAVCSGKDFDLMRSLGADEVLDYRLEDFAKRGETYDVVLDAVGKHSFFRSRRALKPGGLYAATDRLYNLPLGLLMSRSKRRRIVFSTEWTPPKENLVVLKELLEAGKYHAVVDRTYPLEGVVDAARYVETWQKTGNVVLTVA
jgi:NADPH:quinone reductase-like Zn-dependent oxidoreductase